MSRLTLSIFFLHSHGKYAYVKKVVCLSEHPEENKRGDKRGADGLQGSGFGVEGNDCSLFSLRSDYKYVGLACLWESDVSHCLTDFLRIEALTN